jgi:Sigma-70 region 2
VCDRNELELVLLARQGDKAAFSRLVLRYQPMAQRIARQAIGNEDLAQELVQEAMLQAYLCRSNAPQIYNNFNNSAAVKGLAKNPRTPSPMVFRTISLVANPLMAIIWTCGLS